MRSVQDIVNNNPLKKSKINIIATGLDNGKTKYISSELISKYPEYRPEDIVYVYSYLSSVRDDAQNTYPEEFDNLNHLSSNNILTITYQKMHSTIMGNNSLAQRIRNAKVLVLDEIQYLFMQGNMWIMYATDVEYLIKERFGSNVEMVIGFTSAPRIIHDRKNVFSMDINHVNEYPEFRYKADRLICAKIDAIPKIVKYELRGKTVILCLSIDDCYKMHKSIPNSYIVFGDHGGSKKVPITKEMPKVRRFIWRNHRLPDTVVSDGIEFPLEVLITTCIPGDELLFSKESNIRNIISCVGSDIFVSQIAGRMTYEYDCLVVADAPTNTLIFKYEVCVGKANAEYIKHLQSRDMGTWLKSILPYVNCPPSSVEYYTDHRDKQRFSEYIYQNWVVPEGQTCDERKFWIWKEKDKEDIIKEYKASNMQTCKGKVTFNSIMNEIQNGEYGICVKTGRSRTPDKKQYVYKVLLKEDLE